MHDFEIKNYSLVVFFNCFVVCYKVRSIIFQCINVHLRLVKNLNVKLHAVFYFCMDYVCVKSE